MWNNLIGHLITTPTKLSNVSPSVLSTCIRVLCASSMVSRGGKRPGTGRPRTEHYYLFLVVCLLQEKCVALHLSVPYMDVPNV